MLVLAHPPIPVSADVESAAEILGAGAEAGAVLIKGLDVGTPPPTPTVMLSPRGDTQSERVLLHAAESLGTAVGYIQEHGGQVVQNIYPLRDSVRKQISTSSDVQLAFHTETAFHPHKPRYLLLLCRRHDRGAATTLCSYRAVEPHLTAETRCTLAEPRFQIGVDLSFGRGDGWTTGPVPVVTHGRGSRPTFTYDGELTAGLDAGAVAALAELDTTIAAAHTSLVLEAGDLLIIDNHRAVHGRSPFRARFDGTDRWLQRTFVVESVDAIVDRRDHIITTEFTTAA